MKKCLYLIPNGSNLKVDNGKPVIGSSTHIGIGIEQLSRHYEVSTLVLNDITKVHKNDSGPTAISVKGKTGTKSNPLIGVLRDVKALIQNNKRFWTNYKKVKAAKPDFIYERSEYLNLQGLLIARLLRIPHFYEGNWIHFSGIQQFYDSWFNSIAKKIEEWMYSKSSHSFLVGNQNLLLNLKDGKWSTIQNGVNETVINNYINHKNSIENDEIKVCIMASLMKHHRLDIFLKALEYLDSSYNIKVYFIGKHFEPYLDQIPKSIKFEYPGALPKDSLYNYLAKMNIAVISGGPFYSSFMKLFDFAAVKLAVICPDLSNITDNFSTSEIAYFKNEDPKDLARVLNKMLAEPNSMEALGQNLYDKVKNNFTWELIYDRISFKINQYLK